MNAAPVTEAELHAYVDSALPPTRAAEVAQYLGQNADAAPRVAAYRVQNSQLHAAYDDLRVQALPQRLRVGGAVRRRVWYPYAAAALLMLASGTAGWHLHDRVTGARAQTTQIAMVAAMAHAVYSPEVRHPVEVAAATCLAYYRSHIKTEEMEILPQAIHLLQEEDWAQVAAAVPTAPEPLFGNDISGRYRDLRIQIVREKVLTQ